MSLSLSATKIRELLSTLDERLIEEPCDHTYRICQRWAKDASIVWVDLLDVFEELGFFCDCEVAMNLEEEGLVVDNKDCKTPAANRWLLPPDFVPTETTASKIL